MIDNPYPPKTMAHRIFARGNARYAAQINLGEEANRRLMAEATAKRDAPANIARGERNRAYMRQVSEAETQGKPELHPLFKDQLAARAAKAAELSQTHLDPGVRRQYRALAADLQTQIDATDAADVAATTEE